MQPARVLSSHLQSFLGALESLDTAQTESLWIVSLPHLDIKGMSLDLPRFFRSFRALRKSIFVFFFVLQLLVSQDFLASVPVAASLMWDRCPQGFLCFFFVFSCVIS